MTHRQKRKLLFIWLLKTGRTAKIPIFRAPLIMRGRNERVGDVLARRHSYPGRAIEPSMKDYGLFTALIALIAHLGEASFFTQLGRDASGRCFRTGVSPGAR